ncbi:hypothetical protein ACVGVM_20760 [Pseudonocardia bannensis]|uniref:Uncharacterized protein n=1 Tax=Pseudonocardia bannensis TaxID=630973 RepID=A0A848DSU4_9PSEU|nr:hypothetical protein [Pseudonocardia bannensis]NMH95595.1 hypothetical protein [Pseudonocardia bannensis]
MSAPGSVTAAAVGLRCWTRGHDPHVKAAVGLLIAHETWLRRSEFRTGCIERDGDGTCWIDWDDAREAFDAGRFAKASSTEIAVLDLVIALGEDRYRFSRVDGGQARMVTEAVATAVGVDR